MTFLAIGASIAAGIFFFMFIITLVERDDHRDRAKSLYRFVVEVNALDKYIEWDGLRKNKDDNLEVKLYRDYGKAPSETGRD